MHRLILPFLSMLLAGCTVAAVSEPRELALLQQWQGDYPVAERSRLPPAQRDAPVGAIADAQTFAGVWEALRPGEAVPQIDFEEHLVVFVRNTRFYNRTRILRVTLEDGVAEVLAIETMSAMPIEDRVAMALAAVPRVGIRAFRDRDAVLPVPGQ